MMIQKALCTCFQCCQLPAGLVILFLFLLASHQPAQCQTNPWDGKKCAVVLTYDDAISQHLDSALPVLDSLQLKATFYITANTAKERMNDWKNVAANGHELGNHTYYHPCIGGPGREWVAPEYDLNHYTVQKMVDEIKATNAFLEDIDHADTRTFAYTCGDMKIHDSTFIDRLHDDIFAARAVNQQLSGPDTIDLYQINSHVVNGESADQLVEWVRQAVEKEALLVIVFHGVGGGNDLNVSLTDHRKFLEFLHAHEEEIWITTMLEAAQYVRNTQK